MDVTDHMIRVRSCDSRDTHGGPPDVRPELTRVIDYNQPSFTCTCEAGEAESFLLHLPHHLHYSYTFNIYHGGELGVTTTVNFFVCLLIIVQQTFPGAESLISRVSRTRSSARIT